MAPTQSAMFGGFGQPAPDPFGGFGMGGSLFRPPPVITAESLESSEDEGFASQESEEEVPTFSFADKNPMASLPTPGKDPFKWHEKKKLEEEKRRKREEAAKEKERVEQTTFYRVENKFTKPSKSYQKS